MTTDARQQFEKWLGLETCPVHWDESAEKNAWYGFQAGRLSGLQQAADLIEPETKHSAYAAELWAVIREQIAEQGGEAEQ